MKKVCVLVALSCLLILSVSAREGDAKFGLTPALGVFSVWAGGESKYVAPTVTRNFQYRLFEKINVGGRLGGAFNLLSGDILASPLY